MHNKEIRSDKLSKLVMTWWTYTKSKMSCLNITVFWCYDNFKGKRKLTNLIQKILYEDFVELINWLGIRFMQSVKFVSAIFLYQQVIALKQLRKMLFILSKSFFCSQDIQIFAFPSSTLFPCVSHCLRYKLNLKVYDLIS